MSWCSRSEDLPTDRYMAIEGANGLIAAIADALARNDHLPFASVTALAVDRQNMAGEFRRFNYAHMQHHSVFDALIHRQGARAEAIMREHANATLRYAEVFGSTLADERMKVIVRSQ